MRSHRSNILITAVALMFCWPGPAHAYLDPASANLLLQTLVAGILASIFAIKHYWNEFRTGIQKMLGTGSQAQARIEEDSGEIGDDASGAKDGNSERTKDGHADDTDEESESKNSRG